MHRDALSVALITESISSGSKNRRLAALLIANAVRRPPEPSEDELCRYVGQRAPWRCGRSSAAGARARNI